MALGKTYTRKGKVRLSLPLLGINWGETLNPYLAIPLEDKVTVAVYSNSDLKDVAINLQLQEPSEVLLNRLFQTMRTITKIYYEITNKHVEHPLFAIEAKAESTSYLPLVSLYASIASLSVYLIFKSTGYPLDLDELMEILQIAWKLEGVPENIRSLYSSLVLSSFKNKAILYRDSSEYLDLAEVNLKLGDKGTFIELYPDNLSDKLGPEAVSALTKLEGVALIEAATRLNMALAEHGETDVFAILYPYIKIENALYYVLYNIVPRMSRCKYVQSINGVVEEICIAK